MGEVWKGRHRKYGSEVAVKLLTAKSLREEAFLHAFRNEVRAVASLDHPNIVTVFDYGEVSHTSAAAGDNRLLEGTPWLAMELVGGDTLSRKGGRIGWRHVHGVLLSLLDALAHAHARGVIHRDIKPGNVLTDVEGDTWRVKLTDFGLAHAIDAEASTIDDQTVTGTPAFMAPEQFRSRWREYGPWTDLYSLGCLAYYLVSGHPPFEKAKSFQAKSVAHMFHEAPELQPAIAVPPEFEDWARRLMEKDPARRYQRAADAAHAMAAFGSPEGEDTIVASAEEDRPTFCTTLVWKSEWEADVPFDEEQTVVAPRLPSLHSEIPPLPPAWGRPPVERPEALWGAGLGLFGLRSIPLVDREDARDLLWSVLHRARDEGEPRVAVLQGPEGAGKSALARWLGERAHEVGGAIVLKAVHSSVIGPGQGLAAMLRYHFRAQGLDHGGTLARIETTFRAMGVDAPEAWYALAEWISPSTEEDRKDVRTVRFRNDTERYRALVDLLTRLCAERPVVLWLDDVQWGLDALRFARYLLGTRAYAALPVFTVITASDEELVQRHIEREALEDLIGHPKTALCSVGPLPEADRSQLVRSILHLETSLADRVVQRTAGNPRFAVQLLGAWVQAGALEPSAVGFALKQGSDVSLPDGLHDVWAERVERMLGSLSRQAGIALEIAATLGVVVNYAEWHAACAAAGVPAPDTLVDALLAHRLAETTDDDGFAFAHAILRESIMRRADDSGRLLGHHEACATALDGGRGEGHNERLGRHLHGAARPVDALPPLLAGAEERFRAGEYLAAQSLLDLRLDAIEEAGLDQSDPSWGRGRLLRFRIARRRGLLNEAEEWLEKTETAADIHGWPRIGTQALTQRGHLARLRGDLEQSATWLRQAEARAETLGDRALLAECRWDLGEVLTELGALSDADEAVRKALADYRAARDGVGWAGCLQTLGEIAKERGEHAEAVKWMDKAHATYERFGYRWGMASALNSKGDVVRYMGKLEQAEALYRSAEALFSSIGSSSSVYPQYNLGLALMERGAFEDAAAVLQAAAEIFAEQGTRTAMADAHLGFAAVAANQADWDSWDSHFEQAAELYAETGVADEDSARLAMLAAQTAYHAGARDRAREAWLLALDQWIALNRTDEATAVQRLLS